MKKILRTAALFLSLLCIIGMVSCVGNKEITDETKEKTEVNITVLSGTTGMGAAELINKNKNGKTALDYNFSVISDATQVSAGIIGGTIDIAAVPTNLASVLFNKTNGGVQILATCNLGVLYVVENGGTVGSVTDLAGKTVYIPGQGTNPEYILKYVLEKNGLTVGEDVFFDYTYSTPDTLTQAVEVGLADIALLPEPKVTVAKSKNSETVTVVDVNSEWDKVSKENSLVQGCIIARKEFIEANKDAVESFLKEYKESVEFVNQDVNAAAELIAEAGIMPNAKLAEKAIPQCNIFYSNGEDMKNSLKEFYGILFSVNPASIGGKLPNDNIYYN